MSKQWKKAATSTEKFVSFQVLMYRQLSARFLWCLRWLQPCVKPFPWQFDRKAKVRAQRKLVSLSYWFTTIADSHCPYLPCCWKFIYPVAWFDHFPSTEISETSPLVEWHHVIDCPSTYRLTDISHFEIHWGVLLLILHLKWLARLLQLGIVGRLRWLW